MADLATELRRQALKDHVGNDMNSQDDLDIRDASGETPQEMHERILAEDAGEETLDLLESLREMQGGELVTWKVWRIAGPNGEPLRSGPSEYCAELGNTQLTMQNLASLFGGGKYRVKGRYASGKIAGGRTITIAADAKRNEEPMATVAAGSSSSFNMSEFLALQSQMDEKRAERQRQDRKDLLTLIAPLVGGIVQAVISRPTGAAPDLAALITALRPVTSPPDPTSQMKGMIETMLLMQKLNGGSDSDSIGSIIAAVAPHAGPALAALASRQVAPARMRVQVQPTPGSQPTRIQAPAAGTVAPAPAPVTVQATGVQGLTPHTGVNLEAPSQPMSQDDRNMFAQLKPQVDTLVQMFRDGADPVQCAQVFFDTTLMNVDDATYDKLCSFFENPAAIDQISIFNTGVKDLRPQFEAFQNHIKQLVTSQDQAAQNSQGA